MRKIVEGILSSVTLLMSMKGHKVSGDQAKTIFHAAPSSQFSKNDTFLYLYIIIDTPNDFFAYLLVQSVHRYRVVSNTSS